MTRYYTLKAYSLANKHYTNTHPHTPYTCAKYMKQSQRKKKHKLLFLPSFYPTVDPRKEYEIFVSGKWNVVCD